MKFGLDGCLQPADPPRRSQDRQRRKLALGVPNSIDVDPHAGTYRFRTHVAGSARTPREHEFRARSSSPGKTGLSEWNFNHAPSAPSFTAGRSISVERFWHDQFGYIADDDAVLHSQVLNGRRVHHEVLRAAGNKGIDIPEGQSLLDTIFARSLDHG
jgi:hypothetical protein